MARFNCPYCGREIEQTSIWCRFCQRVVSEDLKKNCPSCNESILKWSRHCRFCDASVEMKSPIQTPVETVVTLTQKSDDDDDDDPPPGAGAMVLPRPKKPDGSADQIALNRGFFKKKLLMIR